MGTPPRLRSLATTEQHYEPISGRKHIQELGTVPSQGVCSASSRPQNIRRWKNRQIEREWENGQREHVNSNPQEFSCLSFHAVQSVISLSRALKLLGFESRLTPIKKQEKAFEN